MVKALLTITIGNEYQEIAQLTHPGLSAYARQIGADFISLNTSDGAAPYFQKFRIADFLDIYERILFMDSDIVITDHCPDVFALVATDAFGAWFPNPMIPGRFADQIARAQAELGDIAWTQNYFNSGVMVVSRAHRPIFESAKSYIEFARPQNYFDQTLLNYLVQRNRCPTIDLGFRWNHTAVAEKQDRFQSHFIHYAGGGRVPGLRRADHIRRDLRTLGRFPSASS
jgi:lipopolysaccharide biosynthesis glycosyltransferase